MLVGRQSLPYSLTGSNPYPWIRWWYALVAPSAPFSEEELSLKEREFLRRGKLTSLALLINLIESMLEIGPSLQDKHLMSFYFTLATIGVLFISMILNHKKKLLTSGIFIISALEIGILSSVVTSANGALGYSQLLFLAILIQPLMVSVLLFPAWGVFVVGAINALVTLLLLQIFPKTPELQAYMRTPESGSLFFVPILTTIICALISFIVVTSLQENLIRADKAEEVNKLHQVLGEQTRRELQAKQQLETEVREIVTGMTRFSNGDQQARIQLDRGNTLWSVASSINNLIGRFVRTRTQAQEMERISMALQMYLAEIRTAKVMGRALPPPTTGTQVDMFVEELISTLIQQSQQNSQHSQHSQHGQNSQHIRWNKVDY